MKVFISWSGKETKSHAVACALDEWLPTVLNAVEPWVSSRGLSAGLQWNQQLDKELDETSFGIIVVTPWNQHSQWLNFEAGALSKRVGGLEARVAPLLIDFPNVAQLQGPLSSYQAVLPTQDGIRDLVVSVNDALGEEARKYSVLEKAFEVCWPALESALQKIDESHAAETNPSEAPSPQPAVPEDSDMLSEILNAVRGLARSDARLSTAIRATTDSDLERSERNAEAKARARTIREAASDMGYAVKSIQFRGRDSAHVVVRGPLTDDESLIIIDAIDSDALGLKTLSVVASEDSEAKTRSALSLKI